MKKLLLIASLLMGVGLVRAEMYKHPAANTSQPASVYYGGVKYATSPFTSQITTVPANNNDGFVVYGVMFSTGDCGAANFVDVYESTSIATVTQGAAADSAVTGVIRAARFYNVYGSTFTGTGAINQTCSGFSGAPYPIRVKSRLWFKPNVATYNMINLLYWNQED